jgi:23S rRNA-intervening sequence protein
MRMRMRMRMRNTIKSYERSPWTRSTRSISVTRSWISIRRGSPSLHGCQSFLKQGGVSATSRINWTARPLRSRCHPLNIAEGNGKSTQKDRCKFFDNAHGSALECAAGLVVLVAKAKSTPEEIRPGKESLQKIVRMLMGLIKSNSTRGYDKGNATN